MSLESALDEERREVMALLEGRPSAPRSQRPASPHVSGRAHSPAAAQSPIRSMLDVAAPASARHSSIAGTGVGVTTPAVSSMLNPSSPPPTGGRNPSLNRGPVPSSPLPSARSPASPTHNPESAYQFEMMPTIESQSMPKRVAQGGKKKQGRAMSSVYGSSGDMVASTKDKDRQASLGGLFGKKSGSPGPGPLVD